MAKQIKIGFDKVPAPVTKQYPQLKDIFGANLLDAAGKPLRTEEEATLGVFTSGEQSLSVHLNNSVEDYVSYNVATGYSEVATGGQPDSVKVPGSFNATKGSDEIVYVSATGETIAQALSGVKHIYIGNRYNPLSAGYTSNEYVSPGFYYEVLSYNPGNDTLKISPEFNSDTGNGYFALKAIRAIAPSAPVPVEEQFPEVSEVSSTLLGIPRAEGQLSLFSDVAVYGLDRDNWSTYTYNPVGYPAQWYRKLNPIFGRRTPPRFQEASEEQALYLYSYPSQYDFPQGPRRSPSYLVTNSFREYMNFIAFGKYLYELYAPQYPLFAEQNFINRNISIVNSNITLTVAERNVEINATSYLTDTDPAQIAKVSAGSGGTNEAYDVDYGDNIQDGFDQIERWTAFWQRIKDGIASFPQVAGQEVPFQNSRLVRSFRSFTQQLTQAGGNSNTERFSVLESEKSFRYQPGRVSGFTFGVRLKSDLRSEDNLIEWGASNDTDEYMLQVRGTKLNIVRRSVISLFESDTGQSPTNTTQALRMGYEDVEEAIAAEKLVFPVRLKNDELLQPTRNGNDGTHYELVIDREQWNGDKLDGTGQSGYTLTYEQVTMYKIEFSWYGAIGAKFYAYVPAGNGEARWVLMHTLVIENSLGKPCLRNPDFKFKYFVYSPNTQQLEQPLYLYKYGSSYYIDGGDEGTIRTTSVTADSKEFTKRTPIIGIMPKEEILNGEGIALTNFKKCYPNQVSVTATTDVRIDIEDIQGSPDGHHYYYAPGLKTDQTSSFTENLVFSADGKSIEFVNQSLSWTQANDGAHIIGDGIYGCYVGYSPTNATSGAAFVADLKRKQVGNSRYDEPVIGDEIEPFTLKIDGTEFSTRTGIPFEARVTNFNDIAASTIPITTNKFKIHFLNPRKSDTTFRHSADFLVGVTSKSPELGDSDELLFNDGVGNLSQLDFNEAPNAIWSNSSVRLDLKNREDQEWNPPIGDRFLVDHRLPSPDGSNSGGISAISGEISIVSYEVISIEEETTENSPFIGDYKITFSATAPNITVDPTDLEGSPRRALPNSVEVGVSGEALGIYYTSVSFVEDGVGYAYVDGNVAAAAALKGITQITNVQSAQLTLTDDFKLKSYNASGSSKFPYLEFTKTRLVNFNVLPLYPYFAMMDNCVINNIVIEEISPQGSLVKTPTWIYSPNSGISPTDAPTLGEGVSQQSDQFLPSSFNSSDRLSGVRFDVLDQQPLRPGVTISSFYVRATETVQIDLSNIFSRDRKALARGLLNNRAIYLTATAIDNNGGDVEMAVTVKEQ